MTATIETAEPARKLWTRDEYYRVADLGCFQGEQTELIGGEIVVVSPQSFPHFTVVERMVEVLKRVFDEGYWVRQQGPLPCGDHSEPEPDVSVVPGTRDDYSDHPRHAVLIVEVSYKTLAFDRHQKMSLYASAGCPEYWIANLVDHVLEVYRMPEPDDSQPFGAKYRDVRHLKPGETVAPIEKPEQAIPVTELLPSR